MLATDRDAVQLEHVAQHASAGERKFKCSSSIRRIIARVGVGDRPRQVVTFEREIASSSACRVMGSRGSRRSFLCARIVDATERAGQKIVLQGQLADLRLHVLDTGTLVTPVSPPASGTPPAPRPVQQLRSTEKTESERTTPPANLSEYSSKWTCTSWTTCTRSVVCPFVSKFGYAASGVPMSGNLPDYILLRTTISHISRTLARLKAKDNAT